MQKLTVFLPFLFLFEKEHLQTYANCTSIEKNGQILHRVKKTHTVSSELNPSFTDFSLIKLPPETDFFF